MCAPPGLRGLHTTHVLTVLGSAAALLHTPGRVIGQEGQYRDNTGTIQGQYRDNTGTIQGQCHVLKGPVQSQICDVLLTTRIRRVRTPCSASAYSIRYIGQACIYTSQTAYIELWRRGGMLEGV